MSKGPERTVVRDVPAGRALLDREMDLDLGEVSIIERLMSRDEAALRSVIDEHGSAVFAIASRIVADPARAEEVAQDTFLALWRRPGAFDPERGSLRAFLLGVARNKAIDTVRHEEVLKRTKEALLAETAEIHSDPGLAERVDERQAIKGALMELSVLQREALVLAYFGGRTYRDVAIELGVPEGTVKTRLRDGLIKLRELLATSRET